MFGGYGGHTSGTSKVEDYATGSSEFAAHRLYIIYDCGQIRHMHASTGEVAAKF